MTGASLKKTGGIRAASPEQTAVYIHDMLVSLQRLAEAGKHSRLALLIQQAAGEAEVLSKK